jgi:hypothetical protein
MITGVAIFGGEKIFETMNVVDVNLLKISAAFTVTLVPTKVSTGTAILIFNY